MMKKNIVIPWILVVVTLTGFYSCKRDLTLKNPAASVNGTALISFIDASPHFRAIFGQPDTFNIYINGTKITGYTPEATLVMTYNSIFPTAAAVSGYVSVPAGVSAIKLTVEGVVNPDSIPILTINETLAANKMYTFMITDSINSLRDSSRIFVQDSFPPATAGYYNLRFIHAVWNDTAGENIDIWSTRYNRNIFSNEKPGTITGFSALGANAALNDTLFVRRAGTLIGLDTLRNVSFTTQRTYTLYYGGDGNINVNANVKRRQLATYVHQ